MQISNSKMLNDNLYPNMRNEIILRYDRNAPWIIYNSDGFRIISASLLVRHTCPFELNRYHQAYISIGDATTKKEFKLEHFVHNEFRIEDEYFHIGSDLIALDNFRLEYYVKITVKISNLN